MHDAMCPSGIWHECVLSQRMELLKYAISNRHTAWIYLVVIHLFYFVAACMLQHIQLADSIGYLAQGKNILTHGSWYAAEWNGPFLIDQFSFRPPLYGFFTALCLAIFKTQLGILFIQNILSIVSYLAVFRMLKALQVQTWVINVVSIVMLTCVPTPLLMANMVMADVILMAQLTGVVYLLIKLQQQYSTKHMVITSVLLTSIIFNKPVGMLLPAVVLAWIWFFHFSKWSKTALIQTTVFFSLFPLLGFHLINLQQQHQTGYYHYTSIKPFTQQKFHARYTLAYLYGQDSADLWQAQCNEKIKNAPTYEVRYNTMQQLGDEVLKKHPLPFLYLFAKGVLVYFLDPGRHDLFAFWGYTKFEQVGLFHRTQSEGLSVVNDVLESMPAHMLLILASAFVCNVLVVFLLIYFAITHIKPHAVAWLLLVIIAYISFATGMLGVARYKTAIFPLLILVSAWSIQLWMQKRKNAKQHV